MAPRDIAPGSDWSDAIIDAIVGCQIFLLILSEHSNQSEQVKREVQNAVSEAKPILPFRIQDIALSKHMRYFIGTPHWLDALSPPMEQHFGRMSQTVGALLVTLVEKGVETAPSSSVHLASSPTREAAIDPDTLARMEADLSRMIGPFASVLVRRNAALHDYDTLCRTLASEVHNDTDREAFLTKYRKIHTATTAPPPVPVEERGIDDKAIAAAETALGFFIGPLAKVLTRRAARDASGYDDFLQRLTQQLDTPKEQVAFLKKLGR